MIMDPPNEIGQLASELQATTLASAPPEYQETDDDGIWELVLEPRVVRRKRKESRIVFTAPSGSIPLMSVSQESRMAAFLYGKYRNLTPHCRTYFSPVLDYLWIDPGWGDEDIGTETRISLAELECVRNLIVHPNFTERPKRPILSFAHLAKVERVLVAADEKSIAFNTKIMFDTVEDIKRHYKANTNTYPRLDIPYIAVGCLGWVGIQRRLLRHGTEDKRQLVAIFESDTEMRNHWSKVLIEEGHFRTVIAERPRVFHQLRRLQGEEDEEIPPLRVSRTFPSKLTGIEGSNSSSHSPHSKTVDPIPVRRKSLTPSKNWWRSLFKQKAKVHTHIALNF